MKLEEIINAAVEKKVRELVEEAVQRRDSRRWDEKDKVEASTIDGLVSNLIRNVAQEEIENHKETIRNAVTEAIKDVSTTLKLDAYVKFDLPAKEIKYDSTV